MPSPLHFLSPVFINTVGHSAGILLFTLVAVLIARDRHSYGVRQTRLALLAAGLALLWNLGALAGTSIDNPASFLAGSLMTASFAVLSLLPAVLLHVVLQDRARALVFAGYGVSTLAVGIHIAELFRPSLLIHHLALLVIVAGFGSLTLFAFVLERRARRGTELSLVALLLFTASFLHFGYQHLESPWAAEIAWHHIGIPVALLVLLQDYRFLLLDTFLVSIANAGLAALYICLLLLIGRAAGQPRAPFALGIAFVTLCVSLILFAHGRNALNRWIRRRIFLQRNVQHCLARLDEIAATSQNEEELLTLSAQAAAEQLRAETYVLHHNCSDDSDRSSPNAQILLRFSRGDARCLTLGNRRGGRRYLSEEIDQLRRIAAHIVQHVERQRAEQLRELVQTSELRALQAQINPHFLFNVLNTLYGIIDRRSEEARRMVLNLAEVFRYLLRNQNTLIELSEELRIVRAYLEIEALRLGGRLETAIDVTPEAARVPIPVLSIQPIVENAVKHGVAGQTGPGRVTVRARLIEEDLAITVEDTGPGFASSPATGGTGLGLENVRRRLQLSFGERAKLTVSSQSGATAVTLLIPSVQSSLSQVIGKSRTRMPVA